MQASHNSVLTRTASNIVVMALSIVFSIGMPVHTKEGCWRRRRIRRRTRRR